MVEIVKKDENFAAYEPKQKYRFLVEFDRTKLDIEPNLVKSIDRPTLFVHQMSGRCIWQDLKITLLDMICPSTAQKIHKLAASSQPEIGDIVVKVLGPVGDVVEKWEIYGCSILSADFGTLDYKSVDVCDITLTIKFDRAMLVF